VPVPFAYVQVNALLLIVFNLITPFAIAVFSAPEYSDTSSDSYAGGGDSASGAPRVNKDSAKVVHIGASVLLSMVVTMGFTAMWLVANELEDPFGADANDLDVLGAHNEFCNNLDALLIEPWIEEDHWTVAEGEWVPAEPGRDWTAGLMRRSSETGMPTTRVSSAQVPSVRISSSVIDVTQPSPNVANSNKAVAIAVCDGASEASVAEELSHDSIHMTASRAPSSPSWQL